MLEVRWDIVSENKNINFVADKKKKKQEVSNSLQTADVTRCLPNDEFATDVST